MSFFTLLLSFVPLLIFVIVDYFAGLRWGVVFAVAAAIAECVVGYVMFGVWDYTAVGAAVLVIIMGAISLRMKSGLYFKLQPVAMAGILAGVFAYFQMFDEPLLLKLIERPTPFITSEMRQWLEQPMIREFYAKLSGHLVPLFLFHGGVVCYAALRLNNVVWLLIRGPGLYVFVFLLMLIDAKIIFRDQTTPAATADREGGEFKPPPAGSER